jgi:hypothetical protein
MQESTASPSGKPKTVFLDEEALPIADPDHSDEEDRFVLLGLSARLRTSSCATVIEKRNP